jgi:hypothetical protein
MAMTVNSISEEHVRVNIVYAWLTEHGFNRQQIKLEPSFTFPVGRNVFRVDSEKALHNNINSRADILVKSGDGKHNLMIFEVKAPNEPLNTGVKVQALSYARQLLKDDGGIPPFVVLTNGKESLIYNSITEEIIDKNTRLIDHPYIVKGVSISIDEELLIEALEKFISLSSENLMVFCRGQVEYRMNSLKSDDPLMDKKYIPKLYIDREKPRI